MTPYIQVSPWAGKQLQNQRMHFCGRDIGLQVHTPHFLVEFIMAGLMILSLPKLVPKSIKQSNVLLLKILELTFAARPNTYQDGLGSNQLFQCIQGKDACLNALGSIINGGLIQINTVDYIHLYKPVSILVVKCLVTICRSSSLAGHCSISRAGFSLRIHSTAK